MRYDAHLPALYLQGGENSQTLLTWVVLPTIHCNVIFKNWPLCGLCCEGCDRKNLHVPNPPGVVATITGMLKTSQGG